MRRVGLLWVIVFVVTAAFIYFFAKSSMASTAELVLRLREEGEVVQATVASRGFRDVREHTTTREAKFRRVYELTLTGTLSNGAPWTAVEVVTFSVYEEHSEGTEVELQVLPAEPALWLRSASVEAADESGHRSDETARLVNLSAGFGLFVATIASLIYTVVTLMARRRLRRDHQKILLDAPE